MKLSCSRRIAAADSTPATTRRARVCSGGSASNRSDGGRHGFSLRKSEMPTPADEQNAAGSSNAARTGAWRAVAQMP